MLLLEWFQYLHYKRRNNHHRSKRRSHLFFKRFKIEIKQHQQLTLKDPLFFSHKRIYDDHDTGTSLDHTATMVVERTQTNKLFFKNDARIRTKS